MTLVFEDLGLVPWREAHALQLERLEARVREEIPDTLLLVEHPSVITRGRGSAPDAILDSGVAEVVDCERGGEVTLHAPGQLVGYLIRLLPEGRRDLKAHLVLLEELLIGSLDRLGLRARRVEGRTGVWVEDRKIASIGVACRKWCTWHGFALNVSTDLGLFAAIRPCGFDSAVMTSLQRELGEAPQMPRVKAALAAAATAFWPEVHAPPAH
jgi:lipoyl(octanoyl) transferase